MTDAKQPTMVTIPLAEYARLMKAAYHLKLLKQWTGGDYQPWVIECSHPGCTACAVTVGDSSYILPEYHDCKRLTMCDHQIVCSDPEKHMDTYYCDEHAPSYFVNYYEQLKVEQDEWICNQCQEYRDKEAADNKNKLANDVRDVIESKDIELVMAHAPASTQEAIEALQKHDGDIVLAIMDIQNSH